MSARGGKVPPPRPPSAGSSKQPQQQTTTAAKKNAHAREARLREPDHVRAHAVEKVLAVAHEDEALFVLGQVLLQPHARLEVLLVCGGGVLKEGCLGGGRR